MVPSSKVPIVVCCDGGRRSELAADTLIAMGYTNVSILDGGLAASRVSGRPTMSGWGLRGKEYAKRVAVERGVPQMTAEELAERRRQGHKVVVVDVRTDEEYRRGHVPEAYHIPGGQLLRELPALSESRDHTIVVSCAGRTRSILGAETLRMAGVPDVYALENGGMGWRLAGYELEVGAGRGRPRPVAVAPDWVEEATEALVKRAQIRTMAVDALEALQTSREPFYAVDIRPPEEFRAATYRDRSQFPRASLPSSTRTSSRCVGPRSSSCPTTPFARSGRRPSARTSGSPRCSYSLVALRPGPPPAVRSISAKSLHGSSGSRRRDGRSRLWTGARWRNCAPEIHESESSTFAAAASSGPGTSPDRGGWPEES